jgi:uncharacterized membrane protein
MAPIFFQPIVPVVVGFAIAVLVYIYRHVSGRKTDVNYMIVFMNAAATYVFLVLVINHKGFGATYASMLDRGFGKDEAFLAFVFASYHFVREILIRARRLP